MKVIDSRTARACSGGGASVGGDLRHSRELLSKAPESAAEAGGGCAQAGVPGRGGGRGSLGLFRDGRN